MQFRHAAGFLQKERRALSAMFRSKTLFKSLERYAKLAQNASIIIGIFVGMASLVVSQVDRRVTRTLEFGKSYNDGVRKDVLKLRNNWENYSRSIDNFFKAKGEEQRQIHLKFFDANENRALLDNITDFFDVLWACVDARSCDRNTALDLFGRAIDRTYEVAAFYILDTRSKEKDRAKEFGAGLEKFFQADRELALFRYF
jgi:hypothetical protein